MIHPYEVHLVAPSGQRRTLHLQAQSPAHAQLSAIGKVFQQISATIVEAFQAAQLDPQQAAKIQEIAAQLKAIRDHPRP